MKFNDEFIKTSAFYVPLPVARGEKKINFDNRRSFYCRKWLDVDRIAQNSRGSAQITVQVNANLMQTIKTLHYINVKKKASRATRLLQRYTDTGYCQILFMDEHFFTIREKFNL